jgi:predicted PurR-regulated permease PerM
MDKLYRKYGPSVVVLFLLFLTYLIIKPFLIPITTAAVIAYLFYPVFKLINKKITSKSVASGLLIVLIIIVLFIPSFYMIKTLLNEIPTLYSSFIFAAEKAGALNILLSDINLQYGISIDLTTILSNFTNMVINLLQGILFSIPESTLSIGITLFFLYFFFKDGEKILKTMGKILPFGRARSLKIYKKIKAMVNAVVYGQFVTAVVQSLLCLIAYTFLGVKAPLFWAVVTLIFSMIVV